MSIQAHFAGRLTNNANQGQTQNGTTYTTFTVACDSSRRGSDGNYLTNFVLVTVWGRRGDFVIDHFMKGDPILVGGELTLNNYQTNQGEQRSSLEVNANVIEFVPQVPRNRQPQSNNQIPQNQGQQRPTQNNNGGQQQNRQNNPQQAPQGNFNQQSNNYPNQNQNGSQGFQGQNNGYQNNGGQQVNIDSNELPF